MRALPARLAAAALLCACSGAAVGVSGRPETPLPASEPAQVRAPAQAALTATDVGRPLMASRDGVSALEAAAAEPDQADALPLFDSWGWLSESTRTFEALQDTVLQLLRPAGAKDAFAYFAEEAAAAPLSAGLCPGSVGGLDECVIGTGPGRTIVVGRLGPDVFELSGTGADVAPLAAEQARRLTGP